MINFQGVLANRILSTAKSCSFYPLPYKIVHLLLVQESVYSILNLNFYPVIWLFLFYWMFKFSNLLLMATFKLGTWLSSFFTSARNIKWNNFDYKEKQMLSLFRKHFKNLCMRSLDWDLQRDWKFEFVQHLLLHYNEKQSFCIFLETFFV